MVAVCQANDLLQNQLDNADAALFGQDVWG